VKKLAIVGTSHPAFAPPALPHLAHLHSAADLSERPQEWNWARAGCAGHRWAGRGPSISGRDRERSRGEEKHELLLAAGCPLAMWMSSACSIGAHRSTNKAKEDGQEVGPRL